MTDDDDLFEIPPFLRRVAGETPPAPVVVEIEPPKLASMAEITARLKAKRRADQAVARAAILEIAKQGGVTVRAIMARRPELNRKAVATVLFVDSRRETGPLRQEGDVYFLKDREVAGGGRGSQPRPPVPSAPQGDHPYRAPRQQGGA